MSRQPLVVTSTPAAANAAGSYENPPSSTPRPQCACSPGCATSMVSGLENRPHVPNRYLMHLLLLSRTRTPLQICARQSGQAIKHVPCIECTMH